jgi:hypothetical protein
MNATRLIAATTACGALFLAAHAYAAAPAPSAICLNVNQIQRTEATDDRTILFHMRDGKVWRNTLRNNCPMLKTSPFTQVLRAGGLVCANQQTIQVAQTGSTCVLGDFTAVAAGN